MTWTHLKDIHAGGELRIPPYAHILIEANSAVARQYVSARFNVLIDAVVCSECGPSYSIYSGDDLCQLTGFDRGCRAIGSISETGAIMTRWIEEDEVIPVGWGAAVYTPLYPYTVLPRFLARPDVLVVPAAEVERWATLHYSEAT